MNFDKCDGGLPCMCPTTGCKKGQCARRLHPQAGVDKLSTTLGTPRTDDLLKRIGRPKDVQWESNIVYFARQLERELADMEHTVAVLSDTIAGQTAQIATLNAMLDAWPPSSGGRNA